MTDLDQLIAAVEAGTFTQTDFSWGGWHPEVSYNDARMAFAGSLDAAHRLHTALLPDGSGNGMTNWSVTLTRGGRDVDQDWLWHCEIADGSSHVSCDVSEEGEADNPARAWLLAILRATAASRATVDLQTPAGERG